MLNSVRFPAELYALYLTSRSSAVTPSTSVFSSGGFVIISETSSLGIADTVTAFFSTENVADATASVLAARYAYIVYLPASSFLLSVKVLSSAFSDVLYL